MIHLDLLYNYIFIKNIFLYYIHLVVLILWLVGVRLVFILLQSQHSEISFTEWLLK